VKTTLTTLLPLLEEKQDDTRLKEFVGHYEDVAKIHELTVGSPGSS
jgi:hypothetical protein